ncbi:Intradiol ring-cleavage dioxygenase [Minicystis rosea]|nr:Intradiol ring-cleavage dioxygenase [Minicystis rosea]
MRKHDHDHPEGLSHDLRTLSALRRRQALRLLAGASLIPLFGCGRNVVAGTGGTGSTLDACSDIPEETGGPYPGDGSNGPNVLTTSGIVRSDIRSSFGSMSGTAAGEPLTIELTLVDASNGCALLPGYAVYLWHCDRDGNYSLYTASEQNYLRGVQEAGDDGKVTFTSIFPACYSGRWPHIHFEIYTSLAEASDSGNKVKTSQLAMPEDACNEVFATSGYEKSVSNLAQVSLSSDMVFSDGSSTQVATVTGNVTDGYVAKLIVGLAA